MCQHRQGMRDESTVQKLRLLMNQAGLTEADRPVIAKCLEKAEATGRRGGLQRRTGG